MDCESFRKIVVSSAGSVSSKQCSDISISYISGCFLIRGNKVSNVSMKRYAKIGSPLRAPFSKLQNIQEMIL